ncbi:MAG TPA: RDD family protein [Bacteroidetes bacterium]|nr:RDD family protein [Bacteroidota bacterium]
MENQILDLNEQTSYSDYAGFWLRFAAYIIDGILLSVVFFILASVMGVSMLSMMDGMDPEHMNDAQAMAMGGNVMMLIFSSVIVQWLYFAFMESSEHQATLGKKAVGIKVTDMEGNRISFLRATGRHFGKIISGLILYIGYIMAGFTEKKQALHDMMAGCLVVKKQ